MYTPNGSLIEISYDEAVSDCFVFEEEKFVVLKNEQFDDFFDETQTQKENLILFGKIFSKDDTDYIFDLPKEQYDEVLKYYLSLKNAFLEVSKDD